MSPLLTRMREGSKCLIQASASRGWEKKEQIKHESVKKRVQVNETEKRADRREIRRIKVNFFK